MAFRVVVMQYALAVDSLRQKISRPTGYRLSIWVLILWMSSLVAPIVARSVAQPVVMFEMSESIVAFVHAGCEHVEVTQVLIGSTMLWFAGVIATVISPPAPRHVPAGPVIAFVTVV